MQIIRFHFSRVEKYVVGGRCHAAIFLHGQKKIPLHGCVFWANNFTYGVALE